MIFFTSCKDEKLNNHIQELEKENQIISLKYDSINKTEALRFNTILSLEKGEEIDSLLINEYENLYKTFKNEYWKNLVKNRISILKVRASKRKTEKRLFGEWEWVLSDGGWGEDLKTPKTEKKERTIKINSDYTIIYYENGNEIKKDSFYLTSNTFLPERFETFIHFINQKKIEGFEIIGMGNDMRLKIYEPWCQDCPSIEYKKINIRTTTINKPNAR